MSKTNIPNIIHRDKHPISRKNIDIYALKTMYRLKKFGYEAYIVGGAVRDLLLNMHPKDYDIVTNATPSQIRKIFSNSFIIGKRFKLVHVIYNKLVIEVITFRKEPDILSNNGIIDLDNNFGDINEDSIRRDITINALYYNIKDFSIVDYSNGFKDIKKKVIRIIGDPKIRFQEDPLRILRVLRFAAKFNWSIERNTKKAISEKQDLLIHIKLPRLYEEYKKIFAKGFALNSFKLLKKYDLIKYLFLNYEHFDLKVIKYGLNLTDSRFKEKKSVNHIFILAIFLWGIIEHHVKNADIDITDISKLKNIIEKVISNQKKKLTISNNESLLLKNIFLIQYKFNIQSPKNIKFLLHHKYFDMGYDLLYIRYLARNVQSKLYKYWKNNSDK